MDVALLILVILLMTLQNIAQKIYTLKYPHGGAYFYSCICCMGAALFFTLSGGSLVFSTLYLPYSIAFAAAYGTSMVFSLLSVKYGSMAMTALVMSYSLIIPALFGIVMYNEPVSLYLIIGFILLCVSLALIRDRDSEKISINIKWVVCAFLAFLGNGFCSVIQQIQQKTFDGKFKSEFMISAFVIIISILIVLLFIYERKNILSMLKKGPVIPFASGVANGSMNLAVMCLVLLIPSSVAFPLISAGCIIATAIVSTCVYKERFSKKQILGLILGIVSIIFMNI